MDSYEMLSVLFRLVNFGVLIGLLVYAFKTYALDVIRELMCGQQNVRNSLREHQQSLIHQRDLLQEKYAQDVSSAQQIKGQVVFWAKQVQATIDNRQKQRDQAEQSIAKQAQRKCVDMNMARINRLIAKPALEKARTQLEKQFAGDAAQAAFINRITQFLEKSGS